LHTPFWQFLLTGRLVPCMMINFSSDSFCSLGHPRVICSSILVSLPFCLRLGAPGSKQASEKPTSLIFFRSQSRFLFVFVRGAGSKARFQKSNTPLFLFMQYIPTRSMHARTFTSTNTRTQLYLYKHIRNTEPTKP
jgi:hypothetical protein